MGSGSTAVYVILRHRDARAMQPSMRQVKRRINAVLEGVTGYRLVSGRRCAPSGGPSARGLVEEFSETRVSGWVVVDAGADPVRVSLLVNVQEVAATWATDGTPRTAVDEMRVFDFVLRDLWTYCRGRDRLSVRAAGNALPISGHGMYVSPPKDGSRNVAALRTKLADGYVFGQTGRLQRSKRLDIEWQAGVLGLYGQVREVVREALGYDVFLVYGTLLGAVREGSFIGHDLDFDSAYLSRHTGGPAAAAELREIAFLLIDRGLDVKAVRTALHISDPDHHAIKIDLFHLYFDGSGTLQFPFGVAGMTEVNAADWQGTREIDFCASRVLIPRNAKQVVEHIYGPGWRSPKPGFDWGRDRTKRDRTGFLPLSYGEEVYWSNFYQHHEADGGSPLFDAVNARPDIPSIVLDIGCGDGRDALAFGAAGRTVLGLDLSPIAVRKATERASELDLDRRVRFAVCDVTDAGAFKQHVATLTGGTTEPAVFYLRFFLHAVPEDVQESLLASIHECARPGDMLAAEFRTDKDEKLHKTFGKHYRRFQNAPAFGAALDERFEFDVIDEAEGQGLSPYRDEDPHLYRLVARHR